MGIKSNVLIIDESQLPTDVLRKLTEVKSDYIRPANLDSERILESPDGSIS